MVLFSINVLDRLKELKMSAFAHLVSILLLMNWTFVRTMKLTLILMVLMRPIMVAIKNVVPMLRIYMPLN